MILGSNVLLLTVLVFSKKALAFTDLSFVFFRPLDVLGKVPAFQSVVSVENMMRCFGQTRKESPADYSVFIDVVIVV